MDGNKEVWRLGSDGEGDVVASHAPPDEGQRRVSVVAAMMHHRYAPRGHFQPWAKLSFAETTLAYRFAYPTLLCANESHAYLHDVRTGALVQTIDISVGFEQHESRIVCYVDVNERYVFVCASHALHVFARDGGTEVLRIPNDVSVQEAVSVHDVYGKPFFALLPLLPWGDLYISSFMAGALPPPPNHSIPARKSDDGDDSLFFSPR